MTQAQTITSKAKSNLAFALIDLPEEERRHMAEFYAFCRTVDDIVDEPGMTPRERHDALNRWVEVIDGGEGLELTELEEDIIALIQDLELDTTPMLHLIEGCRSDICQQQPRSRDELLDYTYCVACCVGLTSARIMGAGEASYPYAIALGHALQMVNIIRDVAEDCGKSNRIYLPKEDMDRFGYTLEDLRCRVYSPRLQELLKYEADLAETFFAEAEKGIQPSQPGRQSRPYSGAGHGAHLPYHSGQNEGERLPYFRHPLPRQHLPQALAPVPHQTGY